MSYVRVLFFIVLLFQIKAIADVPLEDESVPFQQVATSATHSLNKPWFQKVDITGFAAAGYVETGSDGKHPGGRFLVREASLFFEGEAWTDVSFFLEWQALRLDAESSKVAGQTGEIYLHYKNVLKAYGDDLLSIKIGRMDLPYGEEYLFQDAIDNPFINTSVNWPYGWDEGLMLYGNLSKLGWIFSVMDGSDDRSKDDHPSRAINLKFYGNLTDSAYTSFSYMKNGKSDKTAMEFAGTHLTPVTGGSGAVDSDMYEVNFKYTFAQKGHIWANFGAVNMEDDKGELYSRKLTYYTFEPLFRVNPSFYVAARYSYIGSNDSDKGYEFKGKPYSYSTSYGEEASSLQRTSLVVGFKPNYASVIKLEYSQNTYELIPAATSTTDGKDHSFMGVEFALKF